MENVSRTKCLHRASALVRIALGWCQARCHRPAGPGSDTCIDCRLPNLGGCTCGCYICLRIGHPLQAGASRQVVVPSSPPPSLPSSPSSSLPPTPLPSPPGIEDNIHAAVLTRGKESNVLAWNAEHEWHLWCICEALGTKHPKHSTYKAVRSVIARHMGEYSGQRDAFEAHEVREGTFRRFGKMLQPHLEASGVGVVK